MTDQACRFQHPGWNRIRILLLVNLLGCLSAAGFTVEGLSTRTAVIGSTIQITGDGFDPGQAYQVYIGETPVSATVEGTAGLSFVIPDVRPGQLAVQQGSGAPVPTVFHIEVLRRLRAELSENLPVDREAYAVGTLFSTSEAPGPDHLIEVSNRVPTLVAAAVNPNQPAFMGISLNETQSITLDAVSTVTAMLFAVPEFFSQDPEVAAERLAAIAALPEVAAAAAAVETALAENRAFLDDPLFESHFGEALDAAYAQYLPQPVAPSAGFSGPGRPLEENSDPAGFREDLFTQNLRITVGPRKLIDEEFDHLENLKFEWAGISRDADGKPRHGIKISTTELNSLFKGHPLDHLVHVYRIRPSEFPNRETIENLQGSLDTAYLRTVEQPLDQRLVAGGLSLQLAGIAQTSGALKKAIGLDTLIDNVLQYESEDQIYVPANYPAIYMIRAFNGARFPPQWDLIRYKLPYGLNAHQVALVDNVTIALIDAILLFITRGNSEEAEEKTAEKPQQIFAATDLAGIAKGIAFDILRRGAEGPITASTTLKIVKEGLKQTLDTLATNTFKVGAEQKQFPLRSAIGNMLKYLDFTDKVSNFSTVVTRFWFLANPLGPFGSYETKSMESGIFVVGDATLPRITRLSRLSGPRGSTLAITGRNFSTNPDDVLVRFGPLPTSPDDPSSGGPVARVLAATPYMIGVEVPEDLPGADGPPITTEIWVTIKGRGSDTSANLPDDRDRFTVLSDPVITALNPETPRANGFMQILGTNFNPDPSLNMVKMGNQNVKPIDGGKDFLVVRVPNTDFPLTVRVESFGRISNGYEFTPYIPYFESGNADPGLVIPVTTTVQGNASDGDITLEEALLLARGGTTASGLGRDISRRPEGNSDEWGSYESDWIGDLSGPQPGLVSQDYIRLPEALDGQTILVDKDLPPLGSYDGIAPAPFITVTIDGSSAPGDGIVLENAQFCEIRGFKITGFPGAGLRIKGNSSTVSVSTMEISGTGTGLKVDGPANRLFLKQITVNGTSSHGIHFTGTTDAPVTDVQLDYVRVALADGNGLFLEEAVNTCLINIVDIRESLMNGIALSGPEVWGNQLGQSPNSNTTGPFPVALEALAVQNSGEYGLLITGGAYHNEVSTGHFIGNSLGGILVEGADSVGNALGPASISPAVYHQIHGNTGSGIKVRAPNTGVFRYNIFGNGLLEDNHGIWIDGPDAHAVRLHALRIGYNTKVTPAVAAKNNGSGIAITGGARDITIGSFEKTPSVLDRNFIGGNNNHGIWIDGEGTSNITINHTDIGRANTDASILLNFYARVEGLEPLGNDVHGVAITGGASDVNIGSEELIRDVHIVDHTEGAGVYVSGPQTHGVRVWGTHFGTGYFGENEPNMIGVHLADGAHSNIIGMRGWAYREDTLTELGNLSFHNTFSGCTEAAILIESAGGQIEGTTTANEPPPTPTGANVVINNAIGWAWDEPFAKVYPNHIGILLKGNAFANRIGGIGGTAYEDGNEIRNCSRAGIELRDVAPPIRALSNRISGNLVYSTGSGVDDIRTEAEPVGAGILFSGTSRGNLVGGGLEDENWLSGNMAGIWIEGTGAPDGAAENQVSQIYLINNRHAGIFLRNTKGNTLGPNLQILRNGTVGKGYAGILMENADQNTVAGNWIGIDRSENINYASSNRFHGIQLVNSAKNTIGGVADNRNKISGNQQYGILLEGSDSGGNEIYNNVIGVLDAVSKAPKGNAGAGIAFFDGAHDNQVGGVLTYLDHEGDPVSRELPNYIYANGIGILTSGAGTSGNTFRRNSISINNGRGIENQNGGNHLLPPPMLSSVSPALISGTVDGTQVPDGSVVEIFTDPSDEGEYYIGSAIVVDAAFSLKPPAVLGPRVNATVTHAATGSTSAFSVEEKAVQVFRVSRRNDIPPTTREEPNAGRVLLTAVDFTAVGLAAEVDEIIFKAGGSANEAASADAYQVVLDADGDGRLSSSDVLLEDGLSVSGNDGEILARPKLSIPTDSKRTLLLVGVLNGTAQASETLVFSIESPDKITSFSEPTPFPLPETGGFPIASDTVVLLAEGNGVAGFADFMNGAFPGETDPSIIGHMADPDGDDRANLLEYAEGTDPAVADASHLFDVFLDEGTLVLSVVTPETAPDLAREIVFGGDLEHWTQNNQRILSIEVTPYSEGLERNDIRIDVQDVLLQNIFLNLRWQVQP